jgi:hypothetical protein
LNERALAGSATSTDNHPSLLPYLVADRANFVFSTKEALRILFRKCLQPWEGILLGEGFGDPKTFKGLKRILRGWPSAGSLRKARSQ